MLKIDPNGNCPYDYYHHFELVRKDQAPRIPDDESDGLLPAKILLPPLDPMFDDDKQLQRTQNFGVARTKGGRIFTSYFSCGEHNDENTGNWLVVIASDDNGASFYNAFVIYPPKYDTTRVFEGIPWIAPDGSLWFFYSQSYRRLDGREGVWCIRCENPDADKLEFSAPKRLADGIIPSPPVILKDGRWIILSYHHTYAAFHGDFHNDFDTTFVLADPNNAGIIVNESTDQGQTFKPIASRMKFPFATYFESALVEKLDGTLWILVRGMNCVGECFSQDGGHTWTPILVKGNLPLPNTHFFIRRLKSGRLLLLANYKANMFTYYIGRNNLTALLSDDDGATWSHTLLLDARDGSEQPAFCEGDNGFIYITYGRAPQLAGETLLAIVTEEDIIAGKLVTPGSKLKISAGRSTGMRHLSWYKDLLEIARINGIEM